MRNRFHEQLEQLNVELIEMGALCEEAISAATKAYLEGDRQLGSRMTGSCTEAGLRGAGCRAMAGVADAAVTANSWRQNDGAPVKETWPWS